LPVIVPKYDPSKSNGTFSLGGVTISLGGFVDLTGYYRTRNENRGTATSYDGVPFDGPTPQGDTGEFGLTAQQTRISVKVSGNPTDNSVLLGYGEMDFNNGAGGANSVQSNGYTPRLRQAFTQYTYESWQLYVLAGTAPMSHPTSPARPRSTQGSVTKKSMAWRAGSRTRSAQATSAPTRRRSAAASA
jgi:hypothetical protein